VTIGRRRLLATIDAITSDTPTEYIKTELHSHLSSCPTITTSKQKQLEMWANAQPDGRPAAKFG